MDDKSMTTLLGGLLMEPSAEAMVTGLAFNSSNVVPGDAFFCIVGEKADGHRFAADAVARGAVALVVEHRVDVDVSQFVVSDTRRALALAASAFYGNPSSEMSVVGITGTNGKTTTAYLLEWIFRVAGRAPGVIGTVETRIGDLSIPSSRTTPESLELQALLAQMRDAGVTDVAMEVSSHAVDLHRIDGTHFAAVAFSNLTQDHLDYHHTLEEYFEAKAALFLDHVVDARVICIDDEWGRKLYSMCLAKQHSVITVTRGSFGDLRAIDESFSASGSTFKLRWRGEIVDVALPLVGAFNIDNAALAAACALAVGIELTTVVEALSSAPQVPGRLERVESDRGFSVVVDYAHTPDSLEKAIAALREITTGRVLVVFGCGGDRDATKRPLMGRAALLGDIAIVTSDNPRTEDPRSIVEEVLTGMTGGEDRTVVCVDRRGAIAEAVSLARPGDVVLIAGKGHEDYQIVGDRILEFDDRVVAREELNRLC